MIRFATARKPGMLWGPFLRQLIHAGANPHPASQQTGQQQENVLALPDLNSD
jgi:hypothetical protein